VVDTRIGTSLQQDVTPSGSFGMGGWSAGRFGRLAGAIGALVAIGIVIATIAQAAQPRVQPVPLQSSRAPTLAQPRFEDADFTPWLPNRVLMEHLQRESSRGNFPAYIEGRAENYAVEFRAVLRPKPKGFLSWEGRWNVGDAEFEELHQRLAQRGFILYSRSEFADLAGERRFNGVWIRVKP
jgi:hypothetical protein